MKNFTEIDMTYCGYADCDNLGCWRRLDHLPLDKRDGVCLYSEKPGCFEEEVPSNNPYENYEQYIPNYTKIKQQVTASLSKEDWQKKYKEYLKSDKWKQKRSAVMERCGGICEGCLSAKVTEVHHLTYDSVFDELLYHLVGLCHDCHRRTHNK